MHEQDPLIVALDHENGDDALALMDQLGSHARWYKLGSVLHLKAGERIRRRAEELGASLFLDLKFHDIPNTVEHACRHAAASGARLVTIHLAGGAEMIRRAVDGARQGSTDCRVVGVSLLTSFSADRLPIDLAVNLSAEDYVRHLVANGLKAGIDGIVCSPHETALLRHEFGAAFRIVNPGIRLPENAADDQKRVASPAAAVRDGADHLVVGRPIYAAPNPLEALRAIRKNLAEAR